MKKKLEDLLEKLKLLQDTDKLTNRFPQMNGYNNLYEFMDT